MKFKFQCTSCGDTHEGMCSFGAHAPLRYYEVPSDEREQRCSLGSDDCVIDEKWFFVRGCIEIPVHGEEEVISWGVWVSLSEPSYIQWLNAFKKEKRSQTGPFFGWLNSWLKPYPDRQWNSAVHRARANRSSSCHRTTRGNFRGTCR